MSELHEFLAGLPILEDVSKGNRPVLALVLLVAAVYAVRYAMSLVVGLGIAVRLFVAAALKPDRSGPLREHVIPPLVIGVLIGHQLVRKWLRACVGLPPDQMFEPED